MENDFSSPKETKAGRLSRELRTQIVTQLIPESRLASYQELEEQYSVSRTVVREAVTQLKREGFIQSVDRQGLYVSDAPPHLNRFGIVFGDNAAGTEWSRFNTAMEQEAAAIERERVGTSFVSYYDVLHGPGSRAYEALREDVEAHRVAGLMLMPSAHELMRNAAFKASAIPKVLICGYSQKNSVPSVTTPHQMMCDRMLGWLHERGRRRIATVAMWGYHLSLKDHLRQRGVPHQPQWFQTVGRDNFADVRDIVALLMDYPANQRPDGLMILDDNLTEHAVGGLLQAGVRCGDDIDVIAHCNWPWPVPSPAPIQRIGFHARHVVSLAVRAIQLGRANKKLKHDAVTVAPLFENEINQPWQPDAFER